MKKILLILFLVINLFVFSAFNIQAETSTANQEIDDTYDLSNFRNNTYYRKITEWLEIYNYISKVEEEISISDFQENNAEITFLPMSNYNDEIVARLNEDDEVSLEFTVQETGLYEIGIDFLVPDEFYTIPTIEILINGESQYNELSELELEVLWKIEPLEESIRYNRYGNELLPPSDSVNEWSKYYFDDYNSYTNDNYQFLLETGVNEITIKALNIPLYLGNFYIKGHVDNVNYNEYINRNLNQPTDSENKIITIQAESYSYKNDLEVKASYYKESAMTPYSYKNTVLNQLDGYSQSRGGTKAIIEFNVEDAGYYNIALKALHNTNMGIASAKNIYIDGEIPFTELEGYLFPSSRTYQHIVLGNSDIDYEFYFTEGHHTISIETTISPYIDYIDTLNSIMDKISSISLQVQTITGGNATDTLDWDILKYIPDLEERLNNFADTLEAIYIEIDNLDTGADDIGEVTTLNVAAKQLRRIARTPNRIGSKLTEFSEGSGSAYQLIGNSISFLLSQPLSIDSIYLFNDTELPKPTGSFFRKIWDGIRGFFYSFFDARYNDNDVDVETIEVWVG